MPTKPTTTQEILNYTADVQYEPDLTTAFNKFIKKWCGKYYAHLIDSDDNDGEYIRKKIKQERLTLLKQIQEFECMKEEDTEGFGDSEWDNHALDGVNNRNRVRQQLNNVLNELIKEER